MTTRGESVRRPPPAPAGRTPGPPGNARPPAQGDPGPETYLTRRRREFQTRARTTRRPAAPRPPPVCACAAPPRALPSRG